MKNYKEFEYAIIMIDAKRVCGPVIVDFEFAMHLQVGDVLRFYGDEGNLAPWVENMEAEGKLENINTTEFTIVRRFFDADNLTLFTRVKTNQI